MKISDLNRGDAFVLKGDHVVFVLDEPNTFGSSCLCTFLFSSEPIYLRASREVVKLCNFFELYEKDAD